MNLRKKIIRLAHDKPELRSTLLPILSTTRKQAGGISSVLNHFEKSVGHMVTDPRAFLKAVEKVMVEFVDEGVYGEWGEIIEFTGWDTISVGIPNGIEVVFYATWELSQGDWDHYVEDIVKATKRSRSEDTQYDFTTTLENLVDDQNFLRDLAKFILERAKSPTGAFKKSLDDVASDDAYDWKKLEAFAEAKGDGEFTVDEASYEGGKFVDWKLVTVNHRLIKLKSQVELYVEASPIEPAEDVYPDEDDDAAYERHRDGW